jgi:PQQ-dependent dehydrogenase (methanol/ethanol family)
VGNRSLRQESQAQIRVIIHDGRPNGMPGFGTLPSAQLDDLARWVFSLNTSAIDLKPEGDIAAGQSVFFGKAKCSSCHMVAGRGMATAPDLSAVGRSLSSRDLELAMNHSSGSFRRMFNCGLGLCPEYTRVSVNMRDNTTVRGYLRKTAIRDIQLQTFDGQWRFIAASEYKSVTLDKEQGFQAPSLAPTERRDLFAYLSSLGGVPVGPMADSEPIEDAAIQHLAHLAPGEWATYNGDYSGNRYSLLNQINTQTVGRLQLQWTYPLNFSPLETTPIVYEGVMYVTAPNRVCALDPRSGHEVWCYSRQRAESARVSADASRGATRGVAVLGDRVFFTTDNAHLICLNRLTGTLMWEVVMPEDPSQRYGGTSAPLVVDDLVIAGVSGGDENVRGFLAAYNAASGKPVWKFWPVPKPGEPGSETWRGNALTKGGGGGATWLTGSYDPALGLLYWTTGQPYPSTDGSQREGDNLYSDCVLALEIKTGKLRWYFQFTPHDLHDWDATEPVLLVDTRYKGADRKLLMQANRSGFFYVLDRTNGQFLMGETFVKKMTWASGIESDGRPKLLPANFPTPQGVTTCPAVRGATNWYSTAFNPATRLLYVMAVEDCGNYSTAGFGGLTARDPMDLPGKALRALNHETGKLVWEIPQFGPTEANYSGVLTMAGGLVFYGETGGGFSAVDATNGSPLWSFETNQIWKGSPMTYLDHGKQFVAIAAGNTIYAFALGDK